MNRLLSATALAGTSLLLPFAAAAQTEATPSRGDVARQNDVQELCPQGSSAPECAPDPSQAGTSGDTITVTGSRIARPNLDSVAPVSSVAASELLDTGDLSLGDELSRLPALRSSFTQANSTGSIGTAGINQLDLRGLGPSRTLVVVNGRRHVTSSPGSYNVDVNTIPTALLERVDIQTGGASAVYGSDAISGVVNFVLKRDFDGIDIRLQGGISEDGDRDSQSINIVAGKNFADGRGNIALAFEYAKQDRLLFADRESQTGSLSGAPGFYTVEPASQLVNGVLVTEPAAGDGVFDMAFIGVNGGPYPGGNVVGGSRFGTLSLGGTVQTSCIGLTAANQTNPLVLARRAAVCTGGRSPTTNGEFSDNYVFLPDGTLVRDQPTTDLRPQGGTRFGGLTATGIEGAMLLPGLERYNFNVMGHFEVSPAFEPYIEAKYVRIENDQTSTQPTFVNSTLNPTFSVNNPFLSAQARSTLFTVLGTQSPNATFTLYRFNNDIGTRSEQHRRETHRIVGGVRGDLSSTGNLNYDVYVNWGRTSTFYSAGGNVIVSRFNAAANAVRNAAGQIVCGVNADASSTNDMPGCVPLNLFGEGNTSQAARDYVLYTSTRDQWADQLNAVASLAGDSSGVFELPGGPVGFAIGAEYRREDAYSDYDDLTQSGATFLNSFATFAPKAVSLYEGFGEIRIPLLKDITLIDNLEFQGQARYSKYSTADEGVWAYNVGGAYAPVNGLTFRAGYARAVRQPNLSELYNASTQTFANNFVDPCSQGAAISANPNRVRNCAAAGVPTTVTFVNDAGVSVTQPFVNSLPSGLQGINQGNLDLEAETSKSLTVGFVFEPAFLPGFSLTLDYYNIEVNNVISGLSGQGIINRCYDDPVGIDNQFCSAVFRRTSDNGVVNGTFAGQSGRVLEGVTNNARDFVGVPITPGFINQPFNYAALKTSGIDADIAYRRKIADFDVSTRLLLSWLQKRETFLFVSEPNRSERIHGTLGDPQWQAQFNLDVRYGAFDIGYDLRFIDKMTVGAWETQFSHQGRAPTNADAYPFKWYPSTFYHNLQLGVRANENFRFYFNIDNLLNKLPPYGLTGTGTGSGIYPITGRFYSAGARIRF